MIINNVSNLIHITEGAKSLLKSLVRRSVILAATVAGMGSAYNHFSTNSQIDIPMSVGATAGLSTIRTLIDPDSYKEDVKRSR